LKKALSVPLHPNGTGVESAGDATPQAELEQGGQVGDADRSKKKGFHRERILQRRVAPTASKGASVHCRRSRTANSRRNVELESDNSATQAGFSQKKQRGRRNLQKDKMGGAVSITGAEKGGEKLCRNWKRGPRRSSNAQNTTSREGNKGEKGGAVYQREKRSYSSEAKKPWWEVGRQKAEREPIFRGEQKKEVFRSTYAMRSLPDDRSHHRVGNQCQTVTDNRTQA